MSQLQPPQFPAGEYREPGSYSEIEKRAFVFELAQLPAELQNSVEGLNDQQLDTRYRNWTIRQIIHHLADSHLNCYIRFKWALTEASPLIKSYNESLWSELVDARTHPIDGSLILLEGLHARWSKLILDLGEAEMGRTFFHPELMREISLQDTLPHYVWHGKHHLAQVRWVRELNGW